MLTPLPASMANTISAELAATTDGVANEVGIGIDDLKTRFKVNTNTQHVQTQCISTLTRLGNYSVTCIAAKSL